jgi:hypothetical protein
MRTHNRLEGGHFVPAFAMTSSDTPWVYALGKGETEWEGVEGFFPQELGVTCFHMNHRDRSNHA